VFASRFAEGCIAVVAGHAAIRLRQNLFTALLYRQQQRRRLLSGLEVFSLFIALIRRSLLVTIMLRTSWVRNSEQPTNRKRNSEKCGPQTLRRWTQFIVVDAAHAYCMPTSAATRQSYTESGRSGDACYRTGLYHDGHSNENVDKLTAYF